MTPLPKILLVDDNPDNLKALEVVLRDVDVELVKVTNGNDALKATLHHDFALALLDVQMPGMDGYELANILKTEEKTENLPFIFISAVYTDNINISKGFAKGAYNFFAKPFNPDTLVRSVQLFLDKYNRTHEQQLMNEELKKKNAELEAINLELLLARDEAIRSRKSKEEFLANMSHELRTPMNGIIGYSRLFEGTSLTSEQEEYLQIIRTSGDNLLTIINDILDFSKIEAGKVIFEEVRFRLPELINSTSELMQEKAKEKNLRLYQVIDKKIPEILIGDSLRLNQVLLNFIGNSVKFTERGEIEVNAKLINEDNENVTIEFKVRDTGIGIPDEKLSAIFESFTQASNATSRKYGGTGLGLTISKQLIELQGGTIEVHSKVGKGTVFSFILKLKKSSSQYLDKEIKPMPEQQMEMAESIENVRILLVEDNPVNQQLARAVTSKWGCNIEIAENGKIAVEKLENKDYDVILMDLQMPEMDGYEATYKIRNVLHKYEIPIIAMTAHAIKGESEKCMNAGMNDYISKPFDPKNLKSKIIKHLKRKNEGQDHSLLETASEGILDKKISDLTYLKGISEGNETVVIDMISIFNQKTPEVLAEIKNCVGEHNWKELQQLVHKLKSNIMIMGIGTCIEVVRLIEQHFIKPINTENVPELVTNLEAGCLEAMKELEEEKERLSRKSI